ncbi:aldo/keto reductase family oxidoreductase [Robertmurraya sp. DFI.2.37]|uniref:aldo/keto reductase n=1 Tax=Robertmurraya sp. DFI.2.37 TaxID=3031819 RepID=UPI0023DA6E73|nr:aldo/keto reductase family oxidoreductase [Robertmurraya sp. DFI.2.37]MDF1510216.1 aldo/keto reductase family oxidoreductase [Robertmurraya sp. DFI.2.37]
MERVQLNEDLSFSRLIQGLWRLNEWSLSDEELLSLIEECLELGITTFDHADIYGGYQNEALFGKALALKPSIREKIELVTKCGIKLVSKARPEHEIKYYDTSKEHIVMSAENSLRNLKTDYLDVLLIHRPDPFIDPCEVAEAFTRLNEAGKVKHFGVSNFTPSQFEMLNSYLPFPLITNQIEISASQLQPFQDGTIDQCLQKRVAPMAWSPLAGGGIFSGEDEKSVRIKKALQEVGEELEIAEIDKIMFAWLLLHPAKIMPIIGSGKIERIKAAAESLQIVMTRQQWFKIWIASTGQDVA